MFHKAIEKKVAPFYGPSCWCSS